MTNSPIRKQLRLKNYDYATSGAYFVTFCTANRANIFWENVGANCVRPYMQPPLSAIGRLAEAEIQKIPSFYRGVSIDKYCIMPDHIHLLIVLSNDKAEGDRIHTPTVSRIVKQFKGSISKQIGRPIWQKSFVDRIIRNERGYRAVWEYIHCNPFQLDFAYDNIDFDLF